MSDIEILRRRLSEGLIDRREFLQGATALGMTAAVLPEVLVIGEAKASEPKRGGVFRQAARGGGASDSIDGAALVDSHNVGTSWMCRNCLTEIMADGNVVGDLAESWEASDDATQWVFKLRRGVEFHDGKSLDTEDVAFSINHHRGEGSKSGAAGVVASIDDIKVDGKDTIVFTLKEGSADFPYLVSDFHLIIVPAGTEGTQWDEGNGTGPFVLTAWEPGVRSAGRRNPNYHKEGLPYFDEVESLNVTDPAARANALNTGEVEAMEDPELKTADLLARSEGLRMVEAVGYRHYTIPMDTRVAPFDNNDVREALKYAIDRERILQTILRGHGYVANDHPIQRSNKFFADGLAQRPYDLEKVKFHLKRAGLEGLTVQLHAGDVVSGAIDMAVLYKEHAAAAGLNIEVVREPSDGYWANVWMKKPFVMSYWNGRDTPDWMFSVAYAGGASWNESFWSNERFDALLKEARAELNEERRREMYAELQQICRDDSGAIVPVFANTLTIVSEKIGTPDNVAGNWPLDGWKNTERWWFS